MCVYGGGGGSQDIRCLGPWVKEELGLLSLGEGGTTWPPVQPQPLLPGTWWSLASTGPVFSFSSYFSTLACNLL